MQLSVLEKPKEEPVILENVKEHLRVIDNEEDYLIESYITAAREFCEGHQNRAYYTQKLKLILDELEFPVRLLRPPLQSLEKVELQKDDGSLKEWDSSNYIVDDTGEIGYIRLANNYDIPSGLAPRQKLQITYTAGFDDVDNVPERVKSAIKLLVGHWHKNREPVSTTGGVPQEIHFTVMSLLNQDRMWPV